MKLSSKLTMGVFLLALAVRLMWLAIAVPKVDPDLNRDHYRGLARSLLAGDGFCDDVGDGRKLQSIAHTPAYPAFLAGLIAISGDRLAWLLVANGALGAVGCALTVVLALFWFPPRWAALTGLLVALDPNSIARCADLLTEMLFTALLLAGLCVLVWRSERTWGWLLAGFFWSLLAMTKPVAAWVWIPACAYARFSRTRPGCALLFLIGFTPLLGLWMARNAALTGHWFVATIATDTAARSFAAGIEADRRGVPIEQVQGEIGRRVGELHFFAGRENLERTLCDTRQFVLSEIRTAPVLAVKHAVLGWTRVLVGPGRQRFANVFRAGDSASDWWTPWYSGALMGFVVLAAFGATRQWRGMLLPVLVVVLLLLPLVGPGVNSRYRVPLTPILAILATAGVRSLRKKP